MKSTSTKEVKARRRNRTSWGWIDGWLERLRVSDGHRADFDEIPDEKESSELDRLQNSLLFQRSELLQLMGDIELDFLGLGESMKEMSKPVRELRGHCDKIIALACGEDEGHAIDFSLQLLKKSEEFASASHRQFESIVVFFFELKKHLLEVTVEQENLIKSLRSLPCIIVHLKIQSSMFDEVIRKRFATLTAETQTIMDRLGDAVERQLNEFKQIEKAEVVISKLISSLSGKVTQHKREVSSHMDECRDNLAHIRESLRNSGGMVEEISIANKVIGRHSSNVVVSLQCQDRVRQKVEHVGAAMEEMVAQLGQFLNTSAVASSRQEAKAYLKEASQIQLGQVGRIMNELKTSAEEISLGIDGIEGGARQISQKALLTSECTFTEDIVRQVADDISKVLSIIQVTVEGVENIKNLVAPFEEGFTNSSGEIQSLALDIRFVSLNAQIYAEHFQEGQALAVLSSNLREVSDYASGIVSIIFGHIEDLREMLIQLNRQLTDFNLLAEREKTFLERESLVSTQKLEESQRELKLLTSQLLSQQQEIDRVHHCTAERLKFPQLVEASSQKAIRYFEELVIWGFQEGESENIVQVVAQRIEHLKKNYTMANELDVHEQAHRPSHIECGPKGFPMLPAPSKETETVTLFDDALVSAAVVASSQDEFGNNVELF